MFVLTLLADTIRVPPHLLSAPTLSAVSSIIERKYPNRIIVDVGLVICPYGPPLDVGDGVLVPGDGGSHHQAVFRCLVFRPFVEEVLVGTVTGCHEGGVNVSVGGFFDHVFIPAYWMLNPSRYDETSGLWVWTPTYDDDGDGMEEEEKGEGRGEGGEDGGEEIGNVKREDDVEGDGGGGGGRTTGEGDTTTINNNRFEIEIGSEIRFKVKAVNFTRVTTTMKGVQATTTTTSTTSATSQASSSSSSDHRAYYGTNGSGPKSSSSSSSPVDDDGGNGGDGAAKGGGGDDDDGAAVRRRSSSADLSDAATIPAPMRIVGSICEDGLGLISWWKSSGEDDVDDDRIYDDDGGVEDGPVGNGMKMEDEEEEE
ncbi:hypothetical protein ACHAW5_001212 [Stephanodiscus triporus]|uniref:RNA polymerase III subunit Rpc25 domain-containing protein n=1 Tax=Stephanodiscus triporus TaxID=2934178 RepID=A0ABD3N313_9STRA